jgi:Rrf2 family protein
VVMEAEAIPTDLGRSSLKRSPAFGLPLRVSAKTDYALRAAAELADTAGGMMKAEEIATAQGIPLKFLLSIMAELKREGIVRSQRGADGGYRLARPAKEITLADVIAAVDGQLMTVRESPPRELAYPGPAASLAPVWQSLSASLRSLLGGITLADLVSGALGTS